MLHAEEPDGLRALIGSRVAVEEIAHGFVEMTLALPCGGDECGALALGGDGGGKVLLGEERGQAKVGRGRAEGVGKPAREASREVRQACVVAWRVVLYRRIIVRQGAFRTCAWPRHRRGLDNDRRLVGAVFAVLGDVARVDVLRVSAAGRVPENGPSAASLLVFWGLWDRGDGGRGAGGRTAGGVDHRL